MKSKSRSSSRSAEDLKQLIIPSFDQERKVNRQFVTALARGLEVLSVYKPFEDPLSNQEIAARTGLPKPTVSRITYTLTKLGYLEYIDSIERYRLGTAVLALGYAFRGGMEIRKLARPHMEEFVRRTGATVTLSTPYRLSFIILDICAAEDSMRLMFDVGSRIEIVESAITAAYFEAIPSADERIMADLASENDPEKWQAMQEELQRCREEIRDQKFCVFSSTMATNVNVAATAVVSLAQDKVYVLQAYAHNSEIDRETFDTKVGPQLVHLSEMIGMEAKRWSL